MVQQKQDFGVTHGRIERVVKHHEYVDVIRNRLVGDERAKDHKAGQMPGASRNAVDSLQSLKLRSPSGIGVAKCSSDFFQRHSVDPFRNIAIRVVPS